MLALYFPMSAVPEARSPLHIFGSNIEFIGVRIPLLVRNCVDLEVVTQSYRLEIKCNGRFVVVGLAVL